MVFVDVQKMGGEFFQPMGSVSAMAASIYFSESLGNMRSRFMISLCLRPMQ